MTDSFIRGGRGKNAPYKSTHARIPQPILKTVNSFADKYRQLIAAGVNDPDGSQLVTRVEDAIVGDAIVVNGNDELELDQVRSHLESTQRELDQVRSQLEAKDQELEQLRSRLADQQFEMTGCFHALEDAQNHLDGWELIRQELQALQKGVLAKESGFKLSYFNKGLKLLEAIFDALERIPACDQRH